MHFLLYFHNHIIYYVIGILIKIVTGTRRLGPPGEPCQSSQLANHLYSSMRLLLQPHQSTHISYVYRDTLMDRTIARAASRAPKLSTVLLNCTPNPV